MSDGQSRTYRAKEFAELAGVTVRALHHYDRLGLLKPRRRTGAGYRLYESRDLERLEQIVALKFLGLPLKHIKILLGRKGLEWSDALSMQRRILEEKRRLLDVAIHAIHQAELAIQRGKQPDSAVSKKIIEVIKMQNDTDWMMKYAGDEATKAKIEARKQLWSPELQARVEKEWADLFRDVEAAFGENPASQKAQALADRWMKLVEGFTGGDPKIKASVKALYADRANWPVEFHQKMEPFSNKKAWDFINQAIAERKRTA